MPVYTLSVSGGAAAAAAAARLRRLREQEEEEMTTYNADDLANDWEFKIVRANRPVFGDPARLRSLREEEARAGWVMVEKFDNSRIRFKRPRQAALNDATLPAGVDPYRVQYGLSPVSFALVMVISILVVVFGIIGAIAFFFAPH